MNFGETVAIQEKTVANEPVRVAVVGDFRRNDFKNVICKIRETTESAYFDSLPLFFQTNGSAVNYDLIFLLASGFGQYFPREISQLYSLYPLAKIIMIAGSLTEGERRTGCVPPDLFRYYWHQWESDALPNFRAFCKHRPSAWGLPACSSDEQRILKTIGLPEWQCCCEFQKLPVAENAHQTALIIADDAAMRDMLVDSMTQAGFDTEMLCLYQVTAMRAKIESLKPAKIMLDVSSENLPETLAVVRLLKGCCPETTRLVVLYNAPRPDEMQQLRHAGANRVISKPFF